MAERNKYIQIHKSDNKACGEFYQAVKDADILGKLTKDINSDPNDNYNILESSLASLKDKYMPIKISRFNKYKHKRTAWITTAIIKSIKYKDNLYKALKLTPPQYKCLSN